MAAYDLHIHSGYSSDGELPVAAIVGLCAARGLDAFSLTDHNSMRGVGEAARLARVVRAALRMFRVSKEGGEGEHV